MRDDELLVLVDQVQRLLEAEGLQPLVDQHRGAVADGRFVEVRSEDVKGRGRRKGLEQAKAGDVRRVDLSLEEQLSGLLDLIEVAIGGTLAIEERTLQMTRDITDDDQDVSLTFHPDIGEDEPTSEPRLSAEELGGWTLGPDSLGRRPAVNAVLETVYQLREAAGLERASWLEPQVERREPSMRALGGW